MNVLLCCLTCAIGNFAWQALSEHDWVRAFERTYFQSVAVLMYAYPVDDVDVAPDSNWLDTALRYDPMPVAEFVLTILWAFAIAAGLVAWCFGQ